MAKFQITVNRTDIYEIEVDEKVINDKWIKHFESYMWDIDEDSPYEELAAHIGQLRARFGSHEYFEGFGIIPVEGEYYTSKEENSLAEGFKMKVISEDEEIEVESREIH